MATWSEPEVKALLREAGIPVPRGVAGLACEGLAEPLVLKAVGPLHKSDVGGVRLGLRAGEVAGAAADMLARGVPATGFLVEEQAPPGVELIVGLVRDPGFGPVLLSGLGGIWTEALDDTALRLCPVTEDDARAMIGSLRGSRLLYGFRGAGPVDVDAVVKLLMAVGGPGGLWERLRLGEFELNPVIASPSGVVAVDARYVEGPAAPPRESRESDFTRLFEPRAVAVVGASAAKPNFGTMFLDFYKAAGTPVVAVHPEGDRVAGVRAVRSLAEAEVDYALVAVPAERCAEVVRQAGGVPYVQVMSGGFGEAGHPEREAELVAAAREAGTRLLGPNCMGVYCPRGRQTFVGGGLGPPGGVALISQSGGLAGEVVKVGERRGLAFSRVVTVGNAADVTPAELLRWLSRDEHTTAVGMYLEDPRDGRALFEALSATSLPTVLLVGGRTRQGGRAAASHTGSMAGDGRVWRALAEQTGTALVTSQDDLIGVLAYFQAYGGAAADGGAGGSGGAGNGGVLVVGPSGGAGVLAADAFDAAGLVLDPLPEDAADELRALATAPGAGPGNPLEIPVGPRGRPSLVREVIEAVVRRQPYRDVVAHVNVQSFFTYGDASGDAAGPLYAYVAELAATRGARITLVTRNADVAPPGVEDRVRELAAGMPVYRTMEAAAVAVAAGRRA
ncbi:acetate--CoA ligase family protein [Thermoactinospora rubra]|uniref:acetate--CoA ligase family protein n=1 Tax=Thermoactinospora rubra TaxID=1088767 RepID=UPI000A12162C|nr:acetate--CoA ligase family protein [Thermoactinospora rubra]